MKKNQFNPPKGKKMLPEQKIHSSYGKIKYNSYGTQSHDGLVIPEIKNHMKVANPKLKQGDIFDEHGDGKPSKKDPEAKKEKKPVVKMQRPKAYSYKKRI
jgi:hypothetical protein